MKYSFSKTWLGLVFLLAVISASLVSVMVMVPVMAPRLAQAAPVVGTVPVLAPDSGKTFIHRTAGETGDSELIFPYRVTMHAEGSVRIAIIDAETRKMAAYEDHILEVIDGALAFDDSARLFTAAPDQDDMLEFIVGLQNGEAIVAIPDSTIAYLYINNKGMLDPIYRTHTPEVTHLGGEGRIDPIIEVGADGISVMMGRSSGSNQTPNHLVIQAVWTRGADWSVEEVVEADAARARAGAAAGGASGAPGTIQGRPGAALENSLFTKIVQAPEGTTLPRAEFAFNFKPVQITISDSPRLRSVAVDEVPTFNDPPYLTVDPEDVYTYEGITTAKIGLDLMELLGSLNYPSGGGTFAWNVSEIEKYTETDGYSVMTYDDAQFQVRAVVEANGRVGSIEIFELLEAENGSGLELGNKLEDGLHFGSVYRTVVGGGDYRALDITTTIPAENNFVDFTTAFDFTLSLLPDSFMTEPFETEARIVNEAGDIIDALPLALEPLEEFEIDFQLSHGDRFEIEQLPAGTTFNATEQPHVAFSSNVTVFVGGLEAAAINTGPNMSISTGNQVITDTGWNGAQFFSNAFFVPPTGLVIGSGPSIYKVLGALLLVGAAYLSYRRRKAIEELPLELEKATTSSDLETA